MVIGWTNTSAGGYKPPEVGGAGCVDVEDLWPIWPIYKFQEQSSNVVFAHDSTLHFVMISLSSFTGLSQ